jgi:hypothetical protein
MKQKLDELDWTLIYYRAIIFFIISTGTIGLISLKYV